MIERYCKKCGKKLKREYYNTDMKGAGTEVITYIHKCENEYCGYYEFEEHSELNVDKYQMQQAMNRDKR